MEMFEPGPGPERGMMMPPQERETKSLMEEGEVSGEPGWLETQGEDVIPDSEESRAVREEMAAEARGRELDRAKEELEEAFQNPDNKMAA